MGCEAGLAGGSGIERKPTVRKTGLKGCGDAVRCAAGAERVESRDLSSIVDVDPRADLRACIILFDEPDLSRDLPPPRSCLDVLLLQELRQSRASVLPPREPASDPLSPFLPPFRSCKTKRLRRLTNSL